MKDANPDQTKTKILVNVYSPLVGLLTRNLNEACLKRDAYLDLILQKECQFLKFEINKNSDEVRKYISKKIKKLNTTPVSLSLNAETVKILNDVCEEKNLPRDAFINRVFLLLVSTPEMLKALFPILEEAFDEDVHAAENGDEQWFHIRPNVIDSVKEFVSASPFWLLRACIDYHNVNKFTSKNVSVVKAGDGYVEEYIHEGHDPLYSHAFSSHALDGLNSDNYKVLRKNEIIMACFNTYMNDEQLVDAADDSDLELLNKYVDENNKQVKEALSRRLRLKSLPSI